jgi:hypothetical protein
MDDYRSQFAALMREAPPAAPPRPARRAPVQDEHDEHALDYRQMVIGVNRATEGELERALLGPR